MKVLLVNPPSKFFEKKLNVSVSMASPPMGLAYIASMLEEGGHEVKISDMTMMSEKEARREIKKYGPDIVGTSCLTNFRSGAFKIMEVAKDVDSDIITIMGGPHATYMNEQILEHVPVDYIVMREGEYTTLELVQKLEKEKPVKKIKGISFKNGKKIVTTEPRGIIRDLDSLPLPSWHLLDLKLYDDIGYNYYNTIKSSELDGKKITKYPMATIITSRGCPYCCQFCSTSSFFGHQWRARTPKNIVNEMELLYNKYKVRFFSFVDDNFTVSPQRVIDISKDIISRNLDIRWICTSRANITSFDMLKWIKKANCIAMGMSPESGSQKILNNIHKQLTVEQIIRTYKMCHKIGLDVNMALMVGNPGESEKTIQETIRVMDKIKPDMIGLNLTKVLPSTELYEIAKKQGFIKDEDWLDPDFMSPVYTVENSLQTLMSWKRKLMIHFYMKHFGVKKAARYVLENPESISTVSKHLLKRVFGGFQQIV